MNTSSQVLENPPKLVSPLPDLRYVCKPVPRMVCVKMLPSWEGDVRLKAAVIVVGASASLKVCHETLD